METVLYKNNEVFNFNIDYPIGFYREMRFERDDYIIEMKAFDDKIFVSAQNDLTLVDFESGEILWERKSDSYIGMPESVDDDNIYTTVDNVAGCLDLRSGKIVWKTDEEKEFLLGSSKKYLYCKLKENGKYVIICRSKKDGKFRWSFNRIFDFPGAVISENGVVILKAHKGLHAFNEESGELLWEFTFDEFNKKYNIGADAGRGGFKGPLADGIFYFSMNKDLLIAVDALNGGLIWKYECGTPTKPRTVIFKDHRLYFSLDQGFSTENALFCVDSENGREIFRTEENFTPKGCYNPIITGNHLIGGNDEYLSFFDLEKQEFVYRFKESKKRPIFGGGIYPYKDQLVICRDKTLFWFRGKK